MTNKLRCKKCSNCGLDFKEKPRESNRQWLDRQYCSMVCNNKSKNRVTCIFDRLETFQIKGNDCWGWSGAVDGGGYPQISNRLGSGNAPEKGHRVSYEKHYGKIPEGSYIMHVCDNPVCTNPEHLKAGTQKDNMKDCSAKGRLNPKSLDNLKHKRGN